MKHNSSFTQRQLDPGRKNPVTTTGHADFTETPDVKWYAVFPGCRPYEGDFYNTGRETFVAPVEWKDGWPVINPGYEEVQYHYPLPMAQLTRKVINNFSGNVFYRDQFENKILDPRFVFLRHPGDNLGFTERQSRWKIFEYKNRRWFCRQPVCIIRNV